MTLADELRERLSAYIIDKYRRIDLAGPLVELVEAAEDVNGECGIVTVFNAKLDKLSAALAALRDRLEE